jgi:molybdenum cofactor cytidylyltransferase
LKITATGPDFINMNLSSHCRIIILAAGSSERLGQPKQLLPFRGHSLIRNMVTAANESADLPPVVVTGGFEEQISKELADIRADIVFNPEWQTGMASSIRAGLLHAMKDAAPEAVMIVLSDQPFVTSGLLTEMFNMQLRSSKPIVACRYADGTIGTPVLFSSDVFPELLQLTGQEGARKIVRSNMERVATIDFPGGETDIDTMDDYRKIS